MKPRSITLLIIFVISVGCMQKESQSFTLTGSIAGDFQGYICLNYEDKTDSTLVEDSEFRFQGKVAHPTEVTLLTSSPNSKVISSVVSFMLENSEIEVALNYGSSTLDGAEVKLLDLDSISGSVSQRLADDFLAVMNTTYRKESDDSLRSEILFTNLNDLVSKNPKSELAGKYVAGYANRSGYLEAHQLQSLLAKMDTSYQKPSDLRYIKNLISRRESLAIGNAPPSIHLPDLNGEMVGADLYKGKFVLLEFWASWCAPCRRSNPALLKVYNDYGGNEFEILGVSIDQDISAWKKAVAEDHLTWVQAVDTLRQTTKDFDITTIPFNVLLDREGKIIATDLKPEELREVLASKI